MTAEALSAQCRRFDTPGISARPTTVSPTARSKDMAALAARSQDMAALVKAHYDIKDGISDGKFDVMRHFNLSEQSSGAPGS